MISDNYYAAFILNSNVSVSKMEKLIKNSILKSSRSSLIKCAYKEIRCLNTHTHSHVIYGNMKWLHLDQAFPRCNGKTNNIQWCFKIPLGCSGLIVMIRWCQNHACFWICISGRHCLMHTVFFSACVYNIIYKSFPRKLGWTKERLMTSGKKLTTINICEICTDLVMHLMEFAKDNSITSFIWALRLRLKSTQTSCH